MFTVDELAQEIRRVDGNHSLGAGTLAEALMPFIAGHMAPEGMELVGWQFNSAGGGWRDCHDEVDARLWLMDGKEIRRVYATAPEATL